MTCDFRWVPGMSSSVKIWAILRVYLLCCCSRMEVDKIWIDLSCTTTELELVEPHSCGSTIRMEPFTTLYLGLTNYVCLSVARVVNIYSWRSSRTKQDFMKQFLMKWDLFHALTRVHRSLPGEDIYAWKHTLNDLNLPKFLWVLTIITVSQRGQIFFPK